MAVRFYSSLDTGAPALPANASFYKNLLPILKACLVNGYNGRPGAGWTIAQENSDSITLQNATLTGYANFFEANQTSNIRVTLMETMDVVPSGVPTGYNRRSGYWFDGQATTNYHYLGGFMFHTAHANKIWYVAADERTAIIFWRGIDVTLDATDPIKSGCLYLGEVDAVVGPIFGAIGGNVNYNGDQYLSNPASANCGSLLRHPLTGAIDQGANPGYRAGVPVENTSSSVFDRQTVGLPFLRFNKVSLQGRGVGLSGSASANFDRCLGRLRGLLCEPVLSASYLYKVFPVLGVQGATYLDILRPFESPDGRLLVPLFPHTSDLGIFVSLDEEDW